ncbi:MAG: hypothetical protein ACHREM_16990, partial [Polyangiales bacterium]
VLAKGASPKLPGIALTVAGAQVFETVVASRYPAMREGVERYADVPGFTAELLPLLEAIAARWTERATRENLPITAYRATITVREEDRERPCHFEALEIRPIHPPTTPPAIHALSPISVAFQPDGKLLARDGDRLVFLVDRQPYAVVPPSIDGANIALDESWRVIHAGELGFAIVAPKKVLFVRGGRWSVMPTPFDPSGREVGEICAVASARGQLVVVTEETDDSEGGPELWRTSDGERWSAPVAIPIGGVVRAVSEGPYGTLLVGDKNGKRGRAAFVAPDGTTTVFASGVASGPGLHLALCSHEREAWGATPSSIVRFDRGAADTELDSLEAKPTALALDLVGVPWLLSEHAVYRRDGASTARRWRCVLERPRGVADLVAIGVTPEGARVIDREGSGVRVVPGDVDRWRRETM